MREKAMNHKKIRPNVSVRFDDLSKYVNQNAAFNISSSSSNGDLERNPSASSLHGNKPDLAKFLQQTKLKNEKG
jgi:hypothetical protein